DFFSNPIPRSSLRRTMCRCGVTPVCWRNARMKWLTLKPAALANWASGGGGRRRVDEGGDKQVVSPPASRGSKAAARRRGWLATAMGHEACREAMDNRLEEEWVVRVPSRRRNEKLHCRSLQFAVMRVGQCRTGN